MVSWPVYCGDEEPVDAEMAKPGKEQLINCGNKCEKCRLWRATRLIVLKLFKLRSLFTDINNPSKTQSSAGQKGLLFLSEMCKQLTNNLSLLFFSILGIILFKLKRKRF